MQSDLDLRNFSNFSSVISNLSCERHQKDKDLYFVINREELVSEIIKEELKAAEGPRLQLTKGVDVAYKKPAVCHFTLVFIFLGNITFELIVFVNVITRLSFKIQG